MLKSTARIPLELIKDHTVPTRTKILFAWIDEQADENNTATISLPDIAKKIGVQKQTALNQLKHLARLGYIEFEKVKENGNYYTIKIKE